MPRKELSNAERRKIELLWRTDRACTVEIMKLKTGRRADTPAIRQELLILQRMRDSIEEERHKILGPTDLEHQRDMDELIDKMVEEGHAIRLPPPPEDEMEFREWVEKYREELQSVGVLVEPPVEEETC